MIKKRLLNLLTSDILYIKDMDKLVHTPTISLRDIKVTENRNPYQRDYARILYSSSFRRLQGKMQVLGIESSAFFRNRLTHSLEVANISKGIRCEIDKTIDNLSSDPSDLFLLEAASLAHDIGHPAFGHKGERVLNKIAERYGMHFEGNAQNFRVLRYIEKKEAGFRGLNLSHRTLLAINKYLVPESFGVKKFMYREDYAALQEIRKNNGLLNQRTIDVQIIELADDIAYAVHDLEDALARDYFSIDELIYELGIKDSSTRNFSDEDLDCAKSQFKKIVDTCRNKASKTITFSNLEEYSQIFRKLLTTDLTYRFIHDVTLKEISLSEAIEHGTETGVKELKLCEYFVLCKLLSKKIFKCITRQPSVILYELRGEKVIKDLFNLYVDRARNIDCMLLPPDYRPKLPAQEKDVVRSAIDYIAGMMDTYALGKYDEYFTGLNPLIK